MTTGRFQLRAMSLGEILDGSFQLYRLNFGRFFLIAFIVQLILFCLQALYQALTPAGTAGLEALRGARAVLYLLNLSIAFILTVFSTGALTAATAESVLGRKLGVFEAYRRINRIYGRLLLTTILSYILIGLGYLFLVLPGVYLSLSFSLLTIVIVMEQKRGFKALSRSWRLIRYRPGGKKMRSFRMAGPGSYGRAFVIFLLVTVISWILSLVVQLPFHIVNLVLSFSDKTSPDLFVKLSGIIRLFANALTRSLVAPFSALAFILLYYDIRIRKEGFDLEMISRSLEDLKK